MLAASTWIPATVGWPMVGWELFAIILVLAVVMVTYEVKRTGKAGTVSQP